MIKINFEDTFEPIEVAEDFSFMTFYAIDKKGVEVMFLKNKECLEEYFVSIGVDWYVRLLRNNDVERDSEGNPVFKPKPEPFDYSRVNDLYRYYMFQLGQ